LLSGRLNGPREFDNTLKTKTFLILFLIYALFHLSRRPLTISRTKMSNFSLLIKSNNSLSKAMKVHPFVFIDGSYNFAYCFFMIFSGRFIANKDKKLWLIISITSSSAFTALFGIYGLMNITSVLIWSLTSFAFGAVQTLALPSVITIFKYIFRKSEYFNSLIMIWTISMPFGNILGTLVSMVCVEYSWEFASFVCAILLFLTNLLVAFIPSEHTADFNLGINDASNNHDGIDWVDLLVNNGFYKYGSISCITKANLGTLFYWLPSFLSQTMPDMPRLKQLALSNLVDIGGIFGIFFAGLLSKMYQPNHYVIISALLGSIAISCLSFMKYRDWTFFCLFFIGLVLSPLLQTMITTLVNWFHAKYYKNDKRAFVIMVTLMDVFGNVGYVIGPLFSGLAHQYSWQAVFICMFLAQMLTFIIALNMDTNDIAKTEYSFNANVDIENKHFFERDGIRLPFFRNDISENGLEIKL